MLDDYFWNFTGTGYETNGETRVRPWPGWHYYENSRSRAELLERQTGLRLTHALGAGEASPESLE